MKYWTRQNKPEQDVFWDLPEQKSCAVQVIGGNVSNFATEIKITEYLNTLNLKEVRLLLPDALKNKLPPLDNITFAPSTESGSFAKSNQLLAAKNSADATLILGDLSKNSATTIAISEILKDSKQPIILTRDSIDAIIPASNEVLEQHNLTFIATFAQLQKLFRSIYYPKMLLLSMPLVQAVETLHKFTISYPCAILTFHQEHFIIAFGGEVTTIPLKYTTYSPISFITGELAAKVTALNAWWPIRPYKNPIQAIHWQ